MKTAYRSHTCGELRLEHEGQTVQLCGWVNVQRDQGGVLFIDLRDRYGVTQVTFRGDLDKALLEQAEAVRSEWVLRVEGKVIARPEAARNPNMATGEVEVEATALTVLSSAKTPPGGTSDHNQTSTGFSHGRSNHMAYFACRAVYAGFGDVIGLQQRLEEVLAGSHCLLLHLAWIDHLQIAEHFGVLHNGNAMQATASDLGHETWYERPTRLIL